MQKLILAAILLACFVVPALAQDEYHKVEGYVGFSHNRVDTGLDDADPDFDDIFDEREGFNGFNASLKGNVSRYVGIKGDYAFHRKRLNYSDSVDKVNVDFDLHTFVGGVEIKDNSKTKKVKPFAHFMAGLVRARASFSGTLGTGSESDTGFGAIIGGGLDFRVGKRVDIRAIQFDYAPTRFGFDGGSQTSHNFRIGVGIVFH